MKKNFHIDIIKDIEHNGFKDQCLNIAELLRTITFNLININIDINILHIDTRL